MNKLLKQIVVDAIAASVVRQGEFNAGNYSVWFNAGGNYSIAKNGKAIQVENNLPAAAEALVEIIDKDDAAALAATMPEARPLSSDDMPDVAIGKADAPSYEPDPRD